MTEVIFAKTRYVYDSYTDFWKLVQLSSFPIVYVDEMELYEPDHIYITAPYNGEWKPHLDNHPSRQAKFMLWNLERPGEQDVKQYRDSNQNLVDDGYFNEIIVSDRELSRQTGFHYIPVGSHARLAISPMGGIKHYDVIHLMCYSLRRAFLFDYLTPHSSYAGISIAPNGWGIERDHALHSSMFMLNIHQDEHPFIEPLRFALASAYGLPIISEKSTDTFPYIVGRDVLEVDNIKQFYKTVNMIKPLYMKYRSLGLMLRTRMCGELSFRNCLEKYI